VDLVQVLVGCCVSVIFLPRIFVIWIKCVSARMIDHIHELTVQIICLLICKIVWP
jgi:hypothetical protein